MLSDVIFHDFTENSRGKSNMDDKPLELLYANASL